MLISTKVHVTKLNNVEDEARIKINKLLILSSMIIFNLSKFLLCLYDLFKFLLSLCELKFFIGYLFLHRR